MDFAYVDRVTWNILIDHAKQESPNECIGYFEAKIVTAGNIQITRIFPCKNISRRKKESGDISVRDEREIKKLMKRDGFVYGMYHSHPDSGTPHLSEKDSFIGRIYKRFRLQIIIGLVGKSRKVDAKFWRYTKPLWTEVEIIVKNKKNM